MFRSLLSTPNPFIAKMTLAITLSQTGLFKQATWINQSSLGGWESRAGLGKPWALSKRCQPKLTSSFGSMDKEEKGTEGWGHPSSTISPPRGLALPYLPANCLMGREKKGSWWGQGGPAETSGTSMGRLHGPQALSTQILPCPLWGEEGDPGVKIPFI